MTTEVIAPSLIPTLPGYTYVDEAVFRAEQERIFEQMWFCAVRSADLDKAGRLADRPDRTGERADQPHPQG